MAKDSLEAARMTKVKNTILPSQSISIFRKKEKMPVFIKCIGSYWNGVAPYSSQPIPFLTSGELEPFPEGLKNTEVARTYYALSGQLVVRSRLKYFPK